MNTIRFSLPLLVLATLAACADQPASVANASADAAPLLGAAPGRGIDGAYIVVLEDGAEPRTVAASAGAHPRHVYSAALNGFAAELNAGQLNALRHHPSVAYVEQDQEAGVIQPLATLQPVPWGLDRIDQRSLPLDGRYGGGVPYTYLPTGAGVYAYVIDTGIQTSHSQFGGRASVAYDALGGNGQDCNGHGTHVAGIIGSASYGVAKGVQLRAVRVLNCSGSGTLSGIIAGIDWVRLNRANPAVANLSLSSTLSSALNTAVTSLVNSGVFVAVQAGDNNAAACNHSPASATAAVTVAASTITDARAPYGNYGSCVDLYAPGTDILSTWLNGGTHTLSGTGMAAAHVTGAAVLYRSTNTTASPAMVSAWIINNATSNLITGNPAGTPNRLLYVGGL